MIREVTRAWLRREQQVGRKHWAGRYKNINTTPVTERFFIGENEQEVKGFLRDLCDSSLPKGVH